MAETMINMHVLAVQLLAEAERVMSVEDFRRTRKNVRGLIREASKKPNPVWVQDPEEKK